MRLARLAVLSVLLPSAAAETPYEEIDEIALDSELIRQEMIFEGLDGSRATVVEDWKRSGRGSRQRVALRVFFNDREIDRLVPESGLLEYRFAKFGMVFWSKSELFVSLLGRFNPNCDREGREELQAVDVLAVSMASGSFRWLCDPIPDPPTSPPPPG